MVINDFLVVGGDGYDMLGGEWEEGILLDFVLIEYLKSVISLWLYCVVMMIDLV